MATTFISSVFGGSYDSADRQAQRKAVLKFSETFNGNNESFFNFFDAFRDHAIDTGIERAFHIECASESTDPKNKVIRNVFTDFGLISKADVVTNFHAWKSCLPQGVSSSYTADQEEALTYVQERSWAYTVLWSSLSGDVKEDLANYSEFISRDGVLLLFTLLEVYAATTREALINAENDLTPEKLELKKFDYNITQYVAYIKLKLRIIRSTGNSISTQALVVIFEQLSSDLLPADMRTTVEPLYRAWRTKSGTAATSIEITDVLAAAELEFKRLSNRQKWDVTAVALESEIIALQASFHDLKALYGSQKETLEATTRSLKQLQAAGGTSTNSRSPAAADDKSNTTQPGGKTDEYKGKRDNNFWKTVPKSDSEVKKHPKLGHDLFWCKDCGLWRRAHGTGSNAPRPHQPGDELKGQRNRQRQGTDNARVNFLLGDF